ncbi:MAG: polysaccharide deacetylase family protein [Oscillospiraceae bacterium]|nr:polysaccharide deacetylase family protein [Oscillospiraceae bacterium]
MRRMAAFFLILSLLVLPVRAAEPKQYVALTFDDGPSGKYTRTLLDGLALRGVHATFLLCGYRMEQYPEITQRIFDEGHEIGFHGFSHDSMREMSRRKIGQELMDSQALLPEDCDPVFFRPPGGFVTDGIRQVAEVRGLSILSWSVDPRDWATDSTAEIEKAVLKNVKDGDIILLHDMTTSSVQAALDIVDVLQQQDFRFVTVSELARLRRTRLKPGQIYTRFPPDTGEQMK